MSKSASVEKVSTNAIAAKLYEAFVTRGINTTKTFAKTVAQLYPHVISDLLTDKNDVELPGVGTFKLKQKAAYTGRNPKTGEPVSVAESIIIGFTPAIGIKKKLNQD